MCSPSSTRPSAGSGYVSLTETLPGGIYTAGVTDLALVSPTPLTGGGDGSNAPDLGTAAPYVFNELPNQILYINFPGLSDITTLTELEAWATGLGTVMLIIDGPAPNFPETELQVAANYVNMTSGTNVLPNTHLPDCLRAVDAGDRPEFHRAGRHPLAAAGRRGRRYLAVHRSRVRNRAEPRQESRRASTPPSSWNPISPTRASTTSTTPM